MILAEVMKNTQGPEQSTQCNSNLMELFLKKNMATDANQLYVPGVLIKWLRVPLRKYT